MMPKKRIPEILLITVGLLQMLGFALHLPFLRQAGSALAASPLPLVFSHFRGFETFASRFEVVITAESGESAKAEITPELYSRLKGPYNRKNTYGAAIAYGPGLTGEREAPLWKSVLHYGFCSPAPLALEFGLPNPIRHASVQAQTKTAGANDSWKLEIPCRQ